MAALIPNIAKGKPMDSVYEIPLRLRRRRDGSMALTDAIGAVLTSDATLKDTGVPETHLFLYTWLNGEGARVARVEHKGDSRFIRLDLANATALYEVVEDQDEQTAAMVALADHKGSLNSLAPERRDGAGAALAAQGILATLVDFKLTTPTKIDEARSEQLAAGRKAREHAEAVAKAKALLASTKGSK